MTGPLEMVPDQLDEAERLLVQAEPGTGRATLVDLLAGHRAMLLMGRAHLTMLRVMYEQATQPQQLVVADNDELLAEIEQRFLRMSENPVRLVPPERPKEGT